MASVVVKRIFGTIHNLSGKVSYPPSQSWPLGTEPVGTIPAEQDPTSRYEDGNTKELMSDMGRTPDPC